jgi:hypothetical protein
MFDQQLQRLIHLLQLPVLFSLTTDNSFHHITAGCGSQGFWFRPPVPGGIKDLPQIRIDQGLHPLFQQHRPDSDTVIQLNRKPVVPFPRNHSVAIVKLNAPTSGAPFWRRASQVKGSRIEV